jgi:hypothetical protein
LFDRVDQSGRDLRVLHAFNLAVSVGDKQGFDLLNLFRRKSDVARAVGLLVEDDGPQAADEI